MQNLGSDVRAELEREIVEMGRLLGIDLEHGNVRVTIALENGRVRWVEPTRVRVPASRLEDG